MIRRAALIALVIAAGTAAAVPLLGPHHYPLGIAAPSPDRVLLSGAVFDLAAPGDPDQLNLELIGDVVATGILAHSGYTLCWGVCEITAPTRSRDLRVRCDSRLRVTESWQLPLGMTMDVRACAQLVVLGTLAAPVGGQVLDVSGTPPALPVVLVSATEILGDWSAGTLPPGTQLAITDTQIILEAAP